jgi:hypothetical protein
VPPIDISSYLSTGSQSVNIALVDEGGWFTNSSVYLATNCTQGGVTGPALVRGNPIGSTPTPQQLTQTFNIDSGSNQQIAFVYDLSEANTANSLTVSGTPSPQVADLPLNPATFQSNLAFNTSFATSECLIHTGELGGPLGQPATLPACKLFTLECTTPANPVPGGAQCPISTVANEVVKDIFDGPNFSLEDIHTRDGRTFHEGIGFLMAEAPEDRVHSTLRRISTSHARRICSPALPDRDFSAVPVKRRIQTRPSSASRRCRRTAQRSGSTANGRVIGSTGRRST